MSVGSLGAEVRRTRIRELMAGTGRLDLAWTAGELGVSEMTVRRDLVELERQGLLRRVRGGAVSVEPEQFDRRAARNNTAKQRIAAKLRTLVPDHGFVALDSSSTIHRLAESLDAPEVTALATGLETFQALRGRVGRALLCGGDWEEATGSFVGPLASRTIKDLYFTRTFVSVTGLDPQRGVLESTIENADIKRALRAASSSLVVAADASKLGTTSAALALPLTDVDILVTDLDPDHDDLAPYRDHVELL
ncbi:MAG: DeoR/GlpR family DNA-binding transcription regulator [Propionibacteriaceae bacterium]|nr:DeoR/GlpR family DNA-binding transcription regulator [Propionibacteriaceae bacterium]